jgi:predicted transcriptional regulator
MSFKHSLALRPINQAPGEAHQINFHNKVTPDASLLKPSAAQAASITQHTKEKLSTVLWEKASTIQGTAQSIHNSSSSLIKYTPSDSASSHNSGA